MMIQQLVVCRHEKLKVFSAKTGKLCF